MRLQVVRITREIAIYVRHVAMHLWHVGVATTLLSPMAMLLTDEQSKWFAVWHVVLRTRHWRQIVLSAPYGLLLTFALSVQCTMIHRDALFSIVMDAVFAVLVDARTSFIVIHVVPACLHTYSIVTSVSEVF